MMVSTAPTPTTDTYVPVVARVAGVTDVGPREKLLTIEMPNGSLGHQPGQFVAVLLPGIGECPISISSAPTPDPTFQICVRAAGSVTNAVHRLTPGAPVGIRGPFGRGFPLAELSGQDVLMVVGGLGMAPLRSLLLYLLERREDFSSVKVLLGSRTPNDILFRDELLQIGGRGDVDMQLTVDVGTDRYLGNVGPVTNLVRRSVIHPERTVALAVGPPVMYRFVLQELFDKGIPDDRIYFSVERNMRCSVGKCGHCQMGPYFVCQDGPVFCYTELRGMPEVI
jgi:NAD(P)H-flavin reductase